MSSYMDELEAMLSSPEDVNTRELLRMLRRVVAELREWRAQASGKFAAAFDRLHDAEERAGAAAERFEALAGRLDAAADRLENLDARIAGAGDRLEALETGFAAAGARFEALESGFAAAGDRLSAVEGGGLSLALVDSTANLPPSAGPRQWFRVTGGTVLERTALYVGNGPGQPLRRIDTLAL